MSLMSSKSFSEQGQGEYLALARAALSRRALTDPIAAYRQALRSWWVLTAQGQDADLAEARRLYQDLLRLLDEVGEPQATRLRREWARTWWQEQGVCPFCGERGPYHDPEGGGEPT